MKTVNELRAFCEGFLMAQFDDDVADMDCWVLWEGYDINLAGANFSGHARDRQLHCDVYKGGWKDTIGEPVHSFTIKGE
jgi:hypothetical protein